LVLRASPGVFFLVVTQRLETDAAAVIESFAEELLEVIVSKQCVGALGS
jgi:hypothetical protein